VPFELARQFPALPRGDRPQRRPGDAFRSGSPSAHGIVRTNLYLPAVPESLRIIPVGTVVVLPFLIGHTALAYYIFRGKATEPSYD